LKFEQILKIYWSRGFLYAGKTQSFNTTFKDFFIEKKGLALKSKILFIKRFEIQYFTLTKNKNQTFLNYPLEQRKIVNMYLSQIMNINNNIFELIKYNLIRYYLIKSYRGRCYALGKPSKGQRTWSNASNASKCNKIIKNFINDVKKFNKIEKKKEYLNVKFLKKKIKIKKPKIKMVFTRKKKNLWF
jgi:ribosomal protein S13